MEALKKHNENVYKKMESLKTYEDFLKEVQNKNPDEFSELTDILTRHTTLEMTNNKLKSDLEGSQKNMDYLIDEMEKYHKDMTEQKVNATNRIGKATDALE